MNDLEIARTEVNKNEFSLSPEQKCYAWVIASILMLECMS